MLRLSNDKKFINTVCCEAVGKQVPSFTADGNVNQLNPYRGQVGNIYQNNKCIYPLTQQYQP